MNIDQLLDEIVEQIYDYDVQGLLQQNIFEISALFNQNQNQQIDIQTFISFFIQKIDESGIDAIVLVTKLVDLYQDVKAKSNTKQLKLKHLTDYVVDGQDLIDNQQYFNARFLPKKDTSKKQYRSLIEAEINPPQILGLNPSMLRRIINKTEIIETHRTKNIFQAALGNKNQELFLLFQFDDCVHLYHSFNFIKTIQVSKKQDGNFIQQICWSQKQQRLGALFRNNQLGFWDRTDNYQFDFQIDCNIDLMKLKYLELQDSWLTVSKNSQIQIWNLGTAEYNIITNPIFAGGIVSVMEINHLQMTIIATQQPSYISCWDLFEQKLLFKFTTQHTTLNQLLSSNIFQLLFAVGFDNFISVYQLHTKYNDQNLVCTLKGHQTTINCIELIEMTSILVSIDCKNIIILWDIRSQTQHQTINLTTRLMSNQIFGYCNKLCYITNKLQALPFETQKMGQKSQKLISIIYDQWNQRNIVITRSDIRIQNIMTGKYQYILSDFQDEISACSLINHGNSMIIGSTEGDLFKVNLKNGEILEKWEGLFQQEIAQICHDEQAQLLHIISEDSTLKCISFQPLNVRKDNVQAKDKRSVRQLIHNNPITCASISVYHGLLANGFDCFLQIWNLEYYSVISQVQLEDSASVTALQFCEKLPILIIGTSVGDVYFLKVLQRNESYICQIESHLNIVKATLIQRIKLNARKDQQDRHHVISNLFSLTSQQLINIYDEDNEEVQIHHMKDKKYKLVTSGCYVVQILIDNRQEDQLIIYLANNKGIVQTYDISKLLQKETIHRSEPIQQRPNYNPYRVIYNNYEEHYIDNYKIVQGKLIKDLKFKPDMKISNTKIKQKFRMSMIRLSVLKGFKDSIEPDITQTVFDPIYNLDETLLETHQIHSDNIVQLRFIQTDPYEIIFQKSTSYILTAGVDDTVKIFSVNFDLICEFNTHQPTPHEWNPILNQQNKLKAQILFALELLNQILPSLSEEKQECYSTNEIMRECSILHLKKKRISPPLQLTQSISQTAREYKHQNHISNKSTLPQLSASSGHVSLRFYNEKMKYTKQQKDIQQQEKQKELSNQRRTRAMLNEQYKIQNKEILDYFTFEPKDAKQEDIESIDKEAKEQAKEMQRLKTETKSNFNQTSKLTRTTNYTDHNKRMITDSTSRYSRFDTKLQETTKTQDFFEYAEIKDFPKTYVINQNASERYKNRQQHKEFHCIIGQMHQKLKQYKSVGTQPYLKGK